MHKLLARQLAHHFGSLEAVPTDLAKLLEAVDQAYGENDSDRVLLERSLDLTSNELMARNENLSREIRERTRTADMLRASEEKYRRIIETASEGMWVIDEEARTSFVNSHMADMLGYEIHEMIGRSIFEFMDEDGRALAEAKLLRRRQGMKDQYDFKFRCRDGTDLWVIVSATPVIDEKGRYRGALGMFTDITYRRKAEESLKAAYEQLKEVDRFRTQFINTAAHELSTPLTPILVQLHLLRRGEAGKFSPAQRSSLEMLERNMVRLRQLISDLLDSARLQSGRLGIRPEPTDLRKIIADTVESFQSMADERGVRIEVEPGQALMAPVDPRRIGQVMFNLLSNAIKFTPSGGAVNVSVERDAGQMTVHVRDNGAGVRPEDIQRMFQPFVQVHDTMQRTRGGTGLGLYICRGILDEHGGSIECRSEGLGKGTEFIFTVPLRARLATLPAETRPVAFLGPAAPYEEEPMESALAGAT